MDVDIRKDSRNCPPPGDGAPPVAPRRRLPGAVVVGLVALALFLGGFAVFLVDVANRAPPADPRADGIVVLTGGVDRIDGALRLLAEGRAGRLLISGVNPLVGAKDLAAVIGSDRRDLLACCTDLDHEARDTIGNASSAGVWAGLHGYRSLIVVTSAYHMPRSLAELSRRLPDTTLVPYPIGDGRPAVSALIARPHELQLLFGEYIKYLGVRIRLLLEPAGQPATPALARAAALD